MYSYGLVLEDQQEKRREPLSARLLSGWSASPDPDSVTNPRRSGRATKESSKAREARESQTQVEASQTESPQAPPEAFFALASAAEKPLFKEPTTFSNAMKTPQAEDWKAACIAEMQSLENNETWTFVDPPKDTAAAIYLLADG